MIPCTSSSSSSPVGGGACQWVGDFHEISNPGQYFGCSSSSFALSLQLLLLFLVLVVVVVVTMDRDTGKLNDLEEVHGHHSVIVAVTDQLQISHLEHNSLRFSWGKSMPNRVLDGWLARWEKAKATTTNLDRNSKATGNCEYNGWPFYSWLAAEAR